MKLQRRKDAPILNREEFIQKAEDKFIKLFTERFKFIYYQKRNNLMSREGYDKFLSIDDFLEIFRESLT